MAPDNGGSGITGFVRQNSLGGSTSLPAQPAPHSVAAEEKGKTGLFDPPEGGTPNAGTHRQQALPPTHVTEFVRQKSKAELGPPVLGPFSPRQYAKTG
jgi:hypothetical protein